MAASVRMSELTWVEYQDRLAQPGAAVLLPTGAIEQHGPHLPLFTDTFLATLISERVAERIGAVVAPPFTYGYKSHPKTGGGNHLTGTTSLDGNTFVCVVRDILCEFARHGARRVAIIDGHYENEWFLTEAIDLAQRQVRMLGMPEMVVLKCAYWEFLSRESERALFPDGVVNWPLEHAAVMETSVMLHLRPDLVRAALIPTHAPARFPLYDRHPVAATCVPASGALSAAVGASADKGKAVIEQVVADLAAAIQHGFGQE